MKVLIALDDSDCSAAAFKSVTERYWAKDAEFRLITVVEPIYLQAPMVGMYCEPMTAAQAEYESYCRKRVQERVKELETQFPENISSGETILGPISECIIDEAKDWNADLIVLGSHGRKGFSRFFLGSVAERVAGHAPCSVEIVKQNPIQKAESDSVDSEAKVDSPSTGSAEKASAEKKVGKATVGGQVN